MVLQEVRRDESSIRFTGAGIEVGRALRATMGTEMGHGHGRDVAPGEEIEKLVRSAY